MSIFLSIFSDPENWALGPIGFWESFSDLEGALHRVVLSFLMIFGLFETGVQSGRLAEKWSYVLRTLVILASCGLLIHSHALGNVRLETLTEISHIPIPISIFGLLTGAFRLLQLWLRRDRPGSLKATAPQSWRGRFT